MGGSGRVKPSGFFVSKQESEDTFTFDVAIVRGRYGESGDAGSEASPSWGSD